MSLLSFAKNEPLYTYFSNILVTFFFVSVLWELLFMVEVMDVVHLTYASQGFSSFSSDTVLS